MSLIRKHVAVLQAWACLALVNRRYAMQFRIPYRILAVLFFYVDPIGLT